MELEPILFGGARTIFLHMVPGLTCYATGIISHMDSSPKNEKMNNASPLPYTIAKWSQNIPVWPLSSCASDIIWSPSLCSSDLFESWVCAVVIHSEPESVQ